MAEVKVKVWVCEANAFRVKPVNVTTPATAFKVVVPARVPVPLIVTVTESVNVLTRFPLASVIQMTGWVASAVPTVAVVDGAVLKINLVGVLAPRTMFAEVTAVKPEAVNVSV